MVEICSKKYNELFGRNKKVQSVSGIEFMTLKMKRILAKYYKFNWNNDNIINKSFILSLNIKELDGQEIDFTKDFIIFYILNFIKYETQLKLYEANKPFITYKDKIEFVCQNYDLFDKYTTDIYIEGELAFTTHFTNQEEANLLIPYAKAFQRKTLQDYKENNIFFSSQIRTLSFDDLKLKLCYQFYKSIDKKELIKNELDKIKTDFMRDKVFGNLFWKIHKEKVDGIEYEYVDSDYSNLHEYLWISPFIEPYVDYYKLLCELKDTETNDLQFIIDKFKNELNMVVDRQPELHISEKDDDEEYNSYKNKLSILLLQYCEYISLGNDDLDLVFIKSLGYGCDNCSSKGDYCPDCIYYWLKKKLSRELCLKAMPFNSYKEKLDFILSHDELFDSLSTSMMVDDEIHFTTFPQNEEESDIYIPIAFELKERENKVRRLSGQKEIDDVPIVSFDELKCNLYSKASKSPEPKLFLENEYSRILNLFPKEKKSGIESIFWYMHHLKVNGTKHFFNFDDDHKSAIFVEYGPLAEHYINYYFYLKDIIENRQDAFIESTQYIDSDFIYFHITSQPALSQSEIDEILYSGKYIVEISRQEPIPYIYNIINSSKVLHNYFKIIIDFFKETILWELPIIKPEFEINADGRRMRSAIEDTFNYRNHAILVISFADTVPDLKESLLTEYLNLITNINKHTPLLSNLKSIIKMNISNKPIMAKEEKKKKDPNLFQKFVYAIDIFGKRKTVTISTIYPIYHYHEVEPIFKAAKKYISAKFTKKKTNLERVLFLDDLLINISDIKSTNDNDMLNVLNYLRPFNFNFEELMQCTDKRISLYYELTMNDKIIPIIYPSESEQDRVIEQRLTFIRFVIYHFKTKMIEYITDLKDKVEMNINLNLLNNSNASSSTEIKETANINYNSYDFFKKWFHYPLEHSPLGYYHQWQENLKYFKTEIQDNVLNLDTAKSNIYLSKLSKELVEIQKTSNTTLEELNVWYKKYNTNEDDLFKNYDYKNTLHKILNSEPINDRNAYDDDLHPDTDGLQRTFYDYHYGQILEKALRFIRDLKIDLEILSSNKNIDKNEKIAPKSEFKKQTKNAGFVLLKNKTKSDKFKHFYYGLFDNGFIGDNLATFRQAFNGTSDSNKIVWLKGQNELNYLIYNLIDKEIIHNYGAWLHTHKMFILENGKPLGTHLKTNYYKGEHAILKNIINSFI